jgi:hypothetical protein
MDVLDRSKWLVAIGGNVDRRRSGADGTSQGRRRDPVVGSND